MGLVCRPHAGGHWATTWPPGPTHPPPTFRGACEAKMEAASSDMVHGAGRWRARAGGPSGAVERGLGRRPSCRTLSSHVLREPCGG